MNTLTRLVCVGKYDGNANPKGARGVLFTKSKAQDVQPLIQLMREVGQKHGGKTPAQVAINWCICKGTLPIPGRIDEVQTKSHVHAAAVLICTFSFYMLSAEVISCSRCHALPIAGVAVNKHEKLSSLSVQSSFYQYLVISNGTGLLSSWVM